MPYTLPPNNRAPLSPGYISDQNNTADVLTGMGAALNVLNTAYAASDFGAQVNNAISAAAGAGGGRVIIPPGSYSYSTGIVSTGKNVYIYGAGRWATQLNYTGSGDAMRIYNTDTTGVLTGGGVYDLTIDGTGAGAGSTGLHYGDMRAGELRLAVQAFSGAGSTGVHFDNQYAWTEETHGYLWVTNCTQCVVFDVSGNTTSTNSYGYTDLTTEILAKVGQDGVVLANGALLYNSRLTVKANFQSSASVQTNAVLRLTGTVPAGHPNAGGFSGIHSCRLDVQAECNATGANAPQTIAWGTLSGNSLLGCTGILDFAGGGAAFAVSNWTATGAAGSFIFEGVIRGDFNLCNATVGLGSAYALAVSGTKIYGKSLLNPANGNLLVGSGDFFKSTLTQSITINMNPGGASTMGGAQRKTVIIQQAAAGGPFTVTWPHTGSPTVSAPTVNWAAGTPPVMTAGANAVDVYRLDTYDGATWYGSATQNVS